MKGVPDDQPEEKYGLHWIGKRRAGELALTPSASALRPCPAESADWDTTANMVIEGDNLEALKLLRESHGGRVKAIFIDPPYNTGRDIVYPNDYRDGVRAWRGRTGDRETDGRLHSNWLSMIYPRLKLAKDLLRPDGVLFCTIDENEAATLALVLKEIFGESAYEHATLAIVHNPRGQQGTNISYVHETAIVVYPADKKKYLADMRKSEVDSRILRDSGTESDRSDARNCFYPFIVRDGAIAGVGDVPANDFHPAAANVHRGDGSIEVWPMTDAGAEKKWRYARGSVGKILDKLTAKMGRNTIQIIYHKDSGTMRSVWQNARYDASEYGTKLLDAMMPGAGFTFPKSLWTVYDALKVMTQDAPDALVLDFFAGSGTTGHALMELNKDIGGDRKYILVQLPEPLDPRNRNQAEAAALCASLGLPPTIAELTKERLRRAGAAIRETSPAFKGDTGFRVFKLEASLGKLADGA
jgi:adenine-specific DNA-methyltransferase